MSEEQQLRDYLAKTLDALRKTRDRLRQLEGQVQEPIAIVGMGCRFPGDANDPESYWRLLRDGVDAITEVPPDRWDAAAYYDSDPDAVGKMITKWCGFLKDLDRWDPEFFGISRREAPSIDPQQRLLLETTWEALESAGLTTDKISGSNTGVYMGLCGDEYLWRSLRAPEALDPYTLVGGFHSTSVGRLSYWLGLTGPNFAIDTACSSSLVAVHLACHALRTRECDMALAGGASAILDPELMVSFSRLRSMSPTGRCHTFSADADGYVRGEGAGVVVLERLADAQKNGRRVLAVIRGSAINQDGRRNGFTAPNGPSQVAVIKEALRRGGVEPASVAFLECHGTGTQLGDPIEVQSGAAALGAGRDPNHPLILGSVKTNFGHAEAAAGVAGIIKAVLMVRHGEIPKSLHFTSPNPHIPWSELPVKVATDLMPWPKGDTPRRVGVNSFGFSGTNAHVVIEEPPPEGASAADPPRPIHLMVLSAKSGAALAEVARRRASVLRDRPLVDVLYTASRAERHELRAAVVGRDADELAKKLDALAEAHAGGTRFRTFGMPRVVFVFPGQGGHFPGMGRELLEREPVFAKAVEECEQAIKPLVDWSLRNLLEGRGPEGRGEDIDVVQPAVFGIQVALAALWKSWGIEPDAVVGHSMGEVTAAYVAGALSLEDAAKVVCHRSRLIYRGGGKGAMALVDLPEAELAAFLKDFEGRISIGAVNSPRTLVVSGLEVAVRELAEKLEQRGIFCRIVKGARAGHSPLMDGILDEMRAVKVSTRWAEAAVPFYSTVTGDRARADMPEDYWAVNIRRTVLFHHAARALVRDHHNVFLEVNPHPILLPSLEESLADVLDKVALVPSMMRKEPPQQRMLESAGELYAIGCNVDVAGFYPRGSRVDLPAYPFQRRRYWIDRVAGAPGGGARVVEEPDAGEEAASITDRLAQAASDKDREAILAEYVSALYARELRTTPSEIDAGLSFVKFGVDSLMAMAVRRRLRAELGVDVALGMLAGRATPADLSAYLGKSRATATEEEADTTLRTHTRTLTLPGNRSLAYVDVGDPAGLPIVCCHGFADSRLSVHPDLQALSDLGLRMIAVDRPGTGLSSPQEGRTLDTWADDVGALVASLGAKRFAVLGWSLGGAFALATAARLPGVCALAIVSGIAPWGREDCDARTRELLEAARGPGGFDRVQRRVALEGITHESPLSEWKNLVSSGALEADQALLERPDICSAMAEGCREAYRQGRAGTAMDFVLGSNEWPFALDSIKAPATLWYGSGDTVCPPRMGHALQKKLPHADVHVVEGAGHLLVYSHWRPILEALRRLAGPSQSG